MRQDCPECQRLWHDLGIATTQHVAKNKELQAAVSEGNRSVAEALTKAVEDLEESRGALREAIRRHEVSAHAKAATNDQ